MSTAALTPAAGAPAIPTGRHVPIYTPIARAIAQDVTVIYYLLTIALTALVLAIQAFGLPALVLTALAAVPVMFTLLILIARP